MTIQCASGNELPAGILAQFQSFGVLSMGRVLWGLLVFVLCNEVQLDWRYKQAEHAGGEMFLPHTYLTALLLMMLSMVCWGSWANAQKIDAAWRFELFYLDYTLGLLAASVLFGLTLGRTDPTSAD